MAGELSVAFSRGAEDTHTLPSRLEEQLERVETEAQGIVLVNEFEQFHTRPLIYSKLTPEQIENIPGLTENERNRLVKFRREFPHADSWDRFGDEFHAEALEVLRYCVIFHRRTALDGNFRWRMIPVGTGDIRWYGKTTLHSTERLEVRLVTERDPGEPVLIDLLGWGAEIRELFGCDHVLVGRIRLRFGHGLAFGNSLGGRKGSDIIRSFRPGKTDIRLNSSTMENAGMTGIVFRRTISQHTVTLLGASTLRDGEITGERVHLPTSGIHRTERSLARRKVLRENRGGVIYQFAGNPVNIAAHLSCITFRHTQTGRSIAPYGVGGVHIDTDWFSHESAFDPNLNHAGVTTLRYSGNSMDAVVAYRRYDPLYELQSAGGIGEFGSTGNEEGFYFGLKWQTGHLRFSAYYDHFRELTDTEQPPYQGDEFLLGVRWKIRPKMYLHFRRTAENKETKGKWIRDDVLYTGSQLREKVRYRCEWRYRWGVDERVAIRRDWIRVQYGGDVGWGEQMYYQFRVPVRQSGWIHCGLSHYRNAGGDAATYVVLSPASGTMRFIRQSGEGIMCSVRWRYRFSEGAGLTCCWIRTGKTDGVITWNFTLQFDIAF